MSTVDLSVIIANYNTRDLLRDCIQSVFDSTKNITFEVIVVDDCSPDDSCEMVSREFPAVRLFRNEVNVRYAKSNNRGLTEARGRYGLLLNSDTITKDGAFETLVKFMDEHPDVAAAGPKLINPDGTVQHCVRGFPGFMPMLFQTLSLHKIWPSHPYSEAYYNTKFSYDKPNSATSIGTTAFIIRRETWETEGMLDERFTLAFVDLAYCHMLFERKRPIYMVPDAVVMHFGSQSINQNGVAEIVKLHDALRTFYDYYVGKSDGGLKRGFVHMLISMRCKLKVLEFKFSKDKRVVKGPGAPPAATKRQSS